MSAAAELFMKLATAQGKPVPGDARAAAFKDQIELDGWQWKLEPSRDTHKPEPSVLSFSKLMDRATPVMLLHMQRGELLKAEIKLIDTSDLPVNSGAKYDGSSFRLTVVLTDARIIDYKFDVEASEGDASTQIKESWTFDYRVIEFRFSPGGKAGERMVSMTRSPEASTKRPEDYAAKMRLLISTGIKDGDLKVGELDKLFAALKREAEKPTEDAGKETKRKRTGAGDHQ